MRLESLPAPFQAASQVMQTILAAGYEAYFVGGSVRDIILGQTIHDVDIATSAFPEELKSLFPITFDVGIEHGTVMVLDGEETYEITTFRTESTYQDFRRPDQVQFVRSLAEDLKRRDFTMNALALSLDGEIIDLYEGIAAIEKREIIAVGQPSERFHEDALRMMRGLRFSSQLNFTIETGTLAAMQQHAQLLEKISVERIHVEFVKMLRAATWKKGFHFLIETGCFRYCPNLALQEENLRKLAQLPENLLEDDYQVWAFLLDGLAITEPAEIQGFLKKWKCSNDVIAHVKKAVPFIQKRRAGFVWSENPLELYQVSPAILRTVEAVLAFWPEPVANYPEALAAYQALPIHDLKDLAVNGRMIVSGLHLSAGPWLGRTLKALESQVLLGELSNDSAELLKAAEALAAEL